MRKSAVFIADGGSCDIITLMTVDLVIETIEENSFNIDVTNKTFLQTECALIYVDVCSRSKLTEKLLVLDRRAHTVAAASKYQESKSILRRFCTLFNWRNCRYIGSMRNVGMRGGKDMLFLQSVVNGKIVVGCFLRGGESISLVVGVDFFRNFHEHIVQELGHTTYRVDDAWY